MTYIFMQLLWPLLLSAGALTGVVWTFQSVQFMDMVLNDGVSTLALLWLAILNVPKFMVVFLPIILFGVVIFVYSRMTTDYEIAIWSACGLSPLRIGQPAIAMAATVTATCYAINLFLMPASYGASQEVRQDIRSMSQLVGLRAGHFNTIDKTLTIYAEDRALDGSLSNILIEDARDRNEPVTIMAQQGQLLGQGSQQQLILSNGNRQVLDPRTGELKILHFESYILPLTQDRAAGDGYRWREPRERFLHELFTLAETGQDATNDHRYRHELRAEAHYRLSSPLLAFTFTLIALIAVLQGQHSRNGRPLRTLTATVVVIVLQVATLSLHSLAARAPGLTPVMYAIPLVSLSAALWLLCAERIHGGRLSILRRASERARMGGPQHKT